jgi:hypothetical protein
VERLSQIPAQSSSQWLQTYYFLRAAVSIVWIALAVAAAKHAPPVAAILFVAYPAWDAFANYLDAQKNGGLRSNPTQMLNFVASIIAAVGIGVALRVSMMATVMAFGAWAIFAGVFQLATAFRRWKSAGAQWVMILSGAQSVLAGLFFFKKASAAVGLDVTTVAPYAAFGAFYFLVSAIWLTVKNARLRSVAAAG